MEQAWDYNDEVMFQPECAGGTPKKVFTNKIEAETEAMKLEKASWIKNNMKEYDGYGGRDSEIFQYILDEEEFEKIDNDYKVKWSLPKNTSDEDFANLIKRLKRTIFYKVVTVKE